MSTVWAIGLSILGIILVFNPIMRIWDRAIARYKMASRIEDYKRLAIQKILDECLMIETINQERATLGLPPFPHKAIIEQFKGIGPWTLLKTKCASIVNDALKNVTGIKLKV